ncbi:hypothetical protein Pint_16234 [Pistacia integerrima]|uniref:Uncharacterized protein n=1 Tax=Pistacia integerrima TaxID=434235 RepID=A0ACC0ZDG7_9ROSI|nr:hypothetical protein Pint_16234 [Pistacia integerrima]
MIMAWIVNAMEEDISANYMCYPTVKELWDNVNQMYSDFENQPQCYEIELKLGEIQQGSEDSHCHLLEKSSQRSDVKRVVEESCWGKKGLLELLKTQPLLLQIPMLHVSRLKSRTMIVLRCGVTIVKNHAIPEKTVGNSMGNLQIGRAQETEKNVVVESHRPMKPRRLTKFLPMSKLISFLNC